MSEASTRRRIADRFVLGGPLGAGGMGSIFRARDEHLGADVAIKLLKRSLLEDAVLRERFRREALSLARLRHPGIVTVLDYGEDEGDLYTVLELVEGETLDGVMGREGAMATERAGPLAGQLLAALEVCHESDIVHRDLKPSNVMVRAARGASQVVLIDFGLARMSAGAAGLERLTETGRVQGTPHYMAPEQCRGEDVGPPGDVYSAGVLFYEMLAGTQPFQGKDAATFMAQHLFVDAPPLREVAPHVSAGVAAAVHAALAKRAEDRPTARELREAIGAAARGEDPEAAAEGAAMRRREVAGMGRRERAIGGEADANADADANAKAKANANVRARVVVWMGRGERSGGLLGCVGTAGLDCAVVGGEELPVGADAVIVSARDGMERVRRLRESAAGLAVIVVDVGGPEETTEVIRAGASDMLLRSAPDADVIAKLSRLLRRRMRT